jgi:hypothetical protein
VNARTDLPIGLVYGMPNDDYHATDALGSSGLKLLRRSPAHYFGQTLDPQRPVREATPAMKAGTLAHCAILEPDKVAERYIVRPDGLEGRTKDGKAWLAALPVGIEAATAEQMQTAQRQAAAVRALPEIGPLLANGHAEVSAFWIDEATGAQCKCRPDFVHGTPSGVILLDVKTTQDAAPDAFQRSIWRRLGTATASRAPPVCRCLASCSSASRPTTRTPRRPTCSTRKPCWPPMPRTGGCWTSTPSADAATHGPAIRPASAS